MVLAVLALGLAAGLAGLGIWQLQRRAWKLDLIARVEQRVHAAPVPAPARADWARVTASGDEYRRVRITGRFLNDRETLVQALTALGAGYWVVTPLQQADGTIVLVNRGFVPPALREPGTRRRSEAAGTITVVGLLRLSEPKGGFLRRNDPEAGRWYSRDTAMIAAARGLPDAAPYFVDADDLGGAGGWPRAGLTIVRFPNNHLLYAAVWFTLALMVLAGLVCALLRGPGEEGETAERSTEAPDHVEPTARCQESAMTGTL
nr:SURF1 family protein [Methylobacterium nodulans]